MDEAPVSAKDPFGHPVATPGELDFAGHVLLARRRWRWILGFGLLSVGGATAYQLNRVSYPLYTGEAMVQRLPGAAGLGALGMPALGGSSDEIASGLEILRTGRVLGSVVDSAGLRLSVIENPALRGMVFDFVDVTPEAASRQYVLERSGGNVRLRTGDQEVAVADGLGLISGPGFVLSVRDEMAIPEGGMTVEVMNRTDAIASLDRAVDTEHPLLTNLIRIRYTDPDPRLAAEVCNLLAAAYQEQAAVRGREEARRRRTFIAGRLESVSDSLRVAQELLLEFQAQSSTLNPQAEGQALSAMLIDAQQGLRDLQARERTLEDLWTNLEGDGREGLRQLMILSSEFLPGAGDLLTRLQEYEDRRTQLTSVNRRTQNSPDVQLLDSLIAETKAEVRLTVDQSLRLSRRELTTAQVRVGELQQQVGSVPGRSVAFGRFEQRVEAIQRMYDMLASRFYEAQIAEVVEAGDVQVVDPAVVPDRPSGFTGRPLPPLLSFVAGLLLGFVAVVAFERFDSRLRSTEEVRAYGGFGILGVIPMMDRKVGDGQLAGLNGSLASEAFRMLRTNIRFSRAEALRRLVITSPGPGEGKSVIAANLAIALAQDGRKVLLIDADLRRPTLHSVFGLQRGPGLSDALIGEQRGVAARVTGRGPSVLTAGTPVPDPSELLGSRAFQNLIIRAQDHYEAIVIDTAPLLAVSDSSLIASFVDGVIVVVRHAQTHRGALAAAADQLRRSGSTVLGVVVNATDGTSPYGYGYGGYYEAYAAEPQLDAGAGNSSSKKRRFFNVPFIGRS